MDTTETYIKMCDCEEIQALRVIANGDFEVRFKHNKGQVEVHHHREITAYYHPENHLWLPRQDQLQEMAWSHIDETYNLLATKLFAFSDYWEENGIPVAFTSMEQLWLAFVMYSLYLKQWNGEKWLIDQRQNET